MWVRLGMRNVERHLTDVVAVTGAGSITDYSEPSTLLISTVAKVAAR